ncbi:hypothetical protein Tco_0130058, partial [Tanacetum coccineum]
DILPNLGPFKNVFELTNGGIIGGNCVVSDLPPKQSWTSTFENDYTGQVKVEHEKPTLRRDLDWVKKKAIPRMLAREFRSEPFDRELVKVQRVFVDHGRELGCQKAREILMASQRLPGCDPNLPRKVKDAVRGLKKV